MYVHIYIYMYINLCICVYIYIYIYIYIYGYLELSYQIEFLDFDNFISVSQQQPRVWPPMLPPRLAPGWLRAVAAAGARGRKLRPAPASELGAGNRPECL